MLLIFAPPAGSTDMETDVADVTDITEATVASMLDVLVAADAPKGTADVASTAKAVTRPTALFVVNFVIFYFSSFMRLELIVSTRSSKVKQFVVQLS
ncbi:hypothetical protein CYG49_01820 [Candidatus Saccharibacteria bacterium]|nr:MAG: hypothetical protein CYG49_01820 [Candidatus Saccharibacteria bacterium]